MAAEATAEDIEGTPSIADFYKRLGKAKYLEFSNKKIFSHYNDQLVSQHSPHNMKRRF